MYAGIFKSIGKVFKEAFLDKFGGPSILQMKRFAEWIETEFSPFLTNVFKILADNIKKQMDGKGSILNSLFSALERVWEWMKANPDAVVKIGTIVFALSALTLGFGTSLIIIGTFLKSVANVITFVLKCFTLFSKVWAILSGSFIAGIAAVVGITIAVKAFAEMWGSGDWTKNSITEYIKKHFPEAQKVIDSFFDHLVKALSDSNDKQNAVWGTNWLSSWIKDALPNAQKKIDEFFDWISTKVLPDFVDGWKLALKEVGKWWDQQIKEMEEGILDLLNILSGLPGWVSMYARHNAQSSSSSSSNSNSGSTFAAAMPASYIHNRSFSTSSIVFNGPLIGTAQIQSENDIDKLSVQIANRIQQKQRARGNLR
jgi:hypothetical protein